ncbi:hypothetical protein J2X20_003984 [Pelomonas saccharophila]|uniref:Uncharacterized protein n=1 Tax=Roseateles saccharophilus TaxID=304 RepID=A0ABU1YTL7_ROSSA|nr:hypothetical protein [Roseateles saccharophilus]MDR7271316.1 hypothetical protein [Roseateles saccharophilus]
MHGIFYNVAPRKTRRSNHPENWVFGHYMEFPSQREDGQWYDAYLFRDQARSVFGRAEYLGEDRPTQDVRDWATRVVADAAFRQRYVTDDPVVVALWKRH